MTDSPSAQFQERRARVLDPSSGPADGADLNWILFQSFPECEIDAEQFVEFLPAFTDAMRDGVAFDYELLYVRLVEMGSAIPREARSRIARIAAERLLADQLDAADAVAALRFVLRMGVGAADTLDRLLNDESLERLRFQVTVDFVLDERELDDYLAISYLRDADPDSGPLLQPFPVPASARERLERFWAPEACRVRCEEGWERWTEPAERETLRAGLDRNLPVSRSTP